MRILITGGAGFIGANLARRCTSAGDEVTVLDDLSTGFADNLAGLPVDFIKGSILDEERLDEAAAGADAIVHLAALPSVPRSIIDPIASHEANATGTLRVLQAGRRHGCHVSVASSSSVYGSNPTLPKSEDLFTRPLSPYATSKLATEGYALAFGASYALPTIAFRFFNVYGPLQAAGHDYAAVIPAFLDASLRGSALPLNGDGLQSRDFTFVDTVTSVLADAARRRVTSPSPVNLALGTNSTLRDLISVIEETLGHGVRIDQRPSRVGDVRASQADSTLLRQLFPEVPVTSLRDGVAQTARWFQSLSEYQ